MINTLLSVGIDIGTTTTHLVVCRLHAANTTGGSRVPRFEIAEREIIHQSEIYFTPFCEDDCIDPEKIKAIVEREYNLAEIKPADINCGAIIITGESARVRNAPSVIDSLSHMAGDFVATSAGPDLESILAAKGSGAKEYSKSFEKTICNLDIGGGTTNIAVYKNGELLETSCLSAGGRFIRFDKVERNPGEQEQEKETVLVKAITDSGRELLTMAGKKIEAGDKTEISELEEISKAVARVILDTVTLKGLPETFKKLFLTETPSLNYKIEQFWFSGGVATLMENLPKNMLKYGDLGPFLACALKDEIDRRKLNLRVANAAIRATVIGAGSHTIQLSGHTVHADQSLLPLKNIPLIKISEPEVILGEYPLELKNLVETKDKNLALVLPEIPLNTYESITDTARILVSAMNYLKLKEPVIFLLKSDSAMALGLQLKKLDGKRKYIVLDGVDTEEGDFIEIGKPIDNGLTLPVTIKTLIFGNPV